MNECNILVVSDTHGNSRMIGQLLENYHGALTAAVHLGDNARDMMRYANHPGIEIYITNGNTDPLVESYEERVVEISGVRIFITHGHRYGVKTGLDNLIYKAKEIQVDVCLFGHTHIPVCFTQDNILFLNPGSPTYPGPETERGYGMLRISDERAVSGKLLTYKEPL